MNSKDMVRSLMTSAESVICFKDLKGKFVLVNQKWINLFDVQLAEIIGKEHYGNYTAEIAAESRVTDRLVEEQKEAQSFQEVVLFSGREYKFLVTKFPVFDNENQLIGIGTISVDLGLQQQRAGHSTGLRDPLTGVLNGEAFKEMAGYEFLRRGRYHQQLSLILVEIDEINEIRKLHGTEVVDKILIEFATLLEDLLRDTDILFRIEDAKFAILAPETGEPGAVIAAKRIRELVNEKDFVPVDMVTVSIGVVEVVSEDELEALIEEVEFALARAKREGSNRVVAASS